MYRVALILMLAIAPPIAGAAPVTWVFGGGITSVELGALDVGFTAPTSFSGSLTFDPAVTLNGLCIGGAACIYTVPASITVRIEEHVLTARETSVIRINGPFLTFDFGGGGQPLYYDGQYHGELGPIGGSSSISLSLRANENFDPLNLTRLVPPATFTGTFGFVLHLFPTPPNPKTIVGGELLTLAAAPEPELSALMFLAVLGATAWWRTTARC